MMIWYFNFTSYVLNYDEVLTFPLDDLRNRFCRVRHGHAGVEEIHPCVKNSAEYLLDFVWCYILIAVVTDTDTNGADFLPVS